LRLCEQETPALAILDVIMPKMGGAAAAAKLAGRFPNLPIVFTSGYSPEAGRTPVAGEKTQYLQKPYSPTALGRLIRESLDLGSEASGAKWHETRGA